MLETPELHPVVDFFRGTTLDPEIANLIAALYLSRTGDRIGAAQIRECGFRGVTTNTHSELTIADKIHALFHEFTRLSGKYPTKIHVRPEDLRELRAMAYSDTPLHVDDKTILGIPYAVGGQLRVS